MRTCAIFGGSFDKFGIEDMKNRKKKKIKWPNFYMLLFECQA